MKYALFCFCLKWELYDMRADRTELNNMAKELPEKVKELSSLYDIWADRSFVKKKRNTTN